MNKLLIATAAVAVLGFAGTAAMAAEATEFAVPVSTLSRAEAAAAAAHAQSVTTAGSVVLGEATQFVDHGDAADRAAVRADARGATRKAMLNTLYVGA